MKKCLKQAFTIRYEDMKIKGMELGLVVEVRNQSKSGGQGRLCEHLGYVERPYGQNRCHSSVCS